jgi:hypothetical protein
VRRGVDNHWRSIVQIRGGIESDPKWLAILQESRKFGFREPHKLETIAAFKTALEMWKLAPPSPNRVLDFRNGLRRVG